MKRYIFAVLALSMLGGFAAKALADTAKLPAADGWTKITTLPTAADLANNYYVFVDNTNDLMLGVGKGVHQNTKWYSLGVYYQTSVEPTSADINGKTWTLESQDGGFAMRNLEYSVLMFQTENNAAWKWDTNDVQNPNGWAKINLAYSDGSWTIENGHDVGNYIGPWDDANFTNGAECAGNKTGNNVGHFQIYAISRTRFKQNLLDNASDSNPVDLTPWYVTNATFDAGNRNGWTEEGSGGNNNTTKGCEIWHRSNFNIYQNLAVPNGNFKVSVQATGSTSGTVYGTSGSTTQTASATIGNKDNFQNSVLEMIKDRNYGRITTDEITVSNGSLTIGFKDETSDQWDVFDNFKLYCTGVDLSAYAAQLSDLVTECNEFIASGAVTDACETAIANAITTYNQNYATGKEYSAAIVALTAVLNTYRNDTDLQSDYAAYKAFRTSVNGLTAGQASSDALTTFNSAVTTANNAVEAATTVAAITTQKASLRSAALTYISSVEGQFDITFLASQQYSDWKKKDGSAAGIVQDQYLANRPNTIPSFAENFEWTATTTGNVLYQTVSDLPAGYYQVGMYTMALSTSQRDDIDTEATEGDANRTFAFAGDLDDASSIQRTGMPIKFATAVNFTDLTTLDVNVHLSNAGNLTYGVQKDANGSNWHFAQIVSVVYSKSPDLTSLQATRDALVAEAAGLLHSSASYLTTAQQTDLNSAITAGNAASTFDALNTVTLTTLPNAINTAKQQVQLVKDNRVLMIAALQRFENDYNKADGTDYRRVTMSADAWATLITKVNAVSTALDDISLATEYASRKDALIAQMNQTDASLRLHKSYQAMSDGTRSFSIGGSPADSETDSDASEEAAIGALNTAFTNYVFTQAADFNASVFLGTNLDFSAAEGAQLNGDNSNNICAVTGWDVAYSDADTWAVVQTHQGDNDGKLYMRKNWGSSATTLTATKERMLPAGRYRLSLSWNSTLENMTNRSCYRLNGTPTSIGKANNGIETLTYDITLTEPTPFDLVIGFQRSGTDNSPAQIVADDIALTCLAPLTFADGSLPEYTPGTYPQVKVSRMLTAGRWATAVYPFAVAKSSDLEIAVLSGYDATNGALSFATADASTPNVPFLMRSTAGTTLLTASNTAVAAASATDATAGNAKLIGTYTSADITNAETNYVLSNNTIYSVGAAGATIPAYRAYIQIAQGNPGAPLFFTIDGETTGIKGIYDSNIYDLPIYDLSGRRIVNGKSVNGKLQKGLYIVNGRKVVIK